MLQIISLFKEQQWEVIFASAAQESPYMEDLETLGVAKTFILLNSDSFDSYLEKLNPTIVMFDRFMTEEQFGWRVERVCSNTMTILDSEDLHCLRQSRKNALKENQPFEVENLLSDELAKRELASIFRCDLSLIISEYEIEVLRNIFRCDNSLLHYMPLFVSLNDVDELPSFEQRKDFMFIGNFHHNPNSDAVDFIKKGIWPLIRKQLPGTSMQIYGAYPSQRILQLHRPSENFYVNGRVADAAKVIRDARVMLAPLRFGAGIKGKLLEAMRFGTPSVTSTIGAEGMTGSMEWNGFVSDKAEDIASSAVRLYQDQKLWSTFQQNGFEIINRRYRRSDFASGFINRILEIQSNISLHRKNNFIGAMLRHHTMKSTEYLSRWISEKNKS